MACGVIVQRLGEPMTEINSAARAILGRTVADKLVRTGATGGWYTNGEGERMVVADLPWVRARATGLAVRGQTVGAHWPGRKPSWIFAESVPAPASNGEEELVVTSFMDVTRLRTAEAILRQHTERLGAIAATQSAAAAEGDYQTVLNLIAEQARLLGGAENAAVLVPQGDLEMVYEAAVGGATDLVGSRVQLAGTLLGRCVSTGKVVLSNNLLAHPDYAVVAKRLRAQSTVMAPLFDGSVLAGVLRIDSPRRDAFGEDQVWVLELLAGFAGTAISRARAQRALAESEALFKSAFEASPLGISLHAPDGRYLRVNRALADLLGYSEKELLQLTFVDVTHPDDLELVHDLSRRLQSTVEQPPPIIKRFLKRDGGVVWVNLVVTAVRDASGAVNGFLANVKDITEQRLAEEELAITQRQLDRAQEIGFIGTWVAWLGPGDQHQVWTSGTLKIFGVDPSTFRGTASEFDARVHPEDRALVAFATARALAGAAYEVDHRIIRPDGETRWIESRGSIIRDEEGKPVRLLGATRDVTEQHLAEMTRLEAETRHLAIVNGALDCIVAMDADGRITEWNPAAERTFGHPRSSVLGRRVEQVIIPRRYRKAHRLGLARYLATGETTAIGTRLELTALRADGSEFPIELAVSALDSAGGSSFAASIRDTTDVTERIKAQQQALDSRSLLLKVINTAPVVLLAFDREGKTTLVEGHALTRLGLDSEAIGTLQVFDLVRESPEPRAHFRRALAGESSAGEVHVASLDVWFDVSYEPLLSPAGQVLGVSVFAIDITDRVRAGRAREESEARSKVTAVMNHEVRTPLNSILGFTELLQSERMGPLNQKQKRYVANVESAGRHLMALVNDSLDLSRMASGQMEFTIEDLDLALILEEVAGQVEPIATAQDLEVRVQAGGAISVRADHRRLLQVLYNLLSNAIKYSPPGGVIGLHGSVDKAEVLIAVADSGVGIPPESLDRIFQEFVMLDAGREGTGLGLPVSRKLTQLMGGEITVVSEVGLGTTFTVRLPRAAEHR